MTTLIVIASIVLYLAGWLISVRWWVAEEIDSNGRRHAEKHTKWAVLLFWMFLAWPLFFVFGVIFEVLSFPANWIKSWALRETKEEKQKARREAARNDLEQNIRSIEARKDPQDELILKSLRENLDSLGKVR